MSMYQRRVSGSTRRNCHHEPSNIYSERLTPDGTNIYPYVMSIQTIEVEASIPVVSVLYNYNLSSQGDLG